MLPSKKKFFFMKTLGLRPSLDNQGYPYIFVCKDSQKVLLKLYSIVTHFVNFKHNFHKEIKTFFQNKLVTLKVDPGDMLQDESTFVRITISCP